MATTEITPENVHPPFVQLVERDVVVERTTNIRDMGTWTEDDRVARAWAIDRAISLRSLDWRVGDVRALILAADDILAYAEDGSVPEPTTPAEDA
jgi:hypothetical protein